jgi:hypothetical protein
MKKFQPTAMLVIGSSPEAIDTARKAIVAILRVREANADTKHVALNLLRSLCAVRNTTITNCHFSQK